MVAAKKITEINWIIYLSAYFYSYKNLWPQVLSMYLFLSFYVIKKVGPKFCCPLGSIEEL